jgi:two-component system, NarL family, sensor histidine kinase DesK
MSVLTGNPVTAAPSPVRRGRGFLFGLHVALVAVAPVFTVTGFQGDPGDPVPAVAAAVAVAALQLRHSFAAARGERPRGWPWTLAALAALVYLPMLRFGLDWAAMQYFVIASGAMLLRGWAAAVVVAAPLAAMAAAVGEAGAYGQGLGQRVFFAAYWIVGLVLGAVALYGSARLVRVLAELDATRAELAELAIGRERLRVSRDLHDLLGHSLSAVSLKGDLAIRLLGSDPPAARAEIESLTGVARDALRGVRAVTRDEHAVSLRTETEGAAALLRAAGIATRVELDLPDLPAPLETMLAWAVREGVTNVLRHSQATSCTIRAGVGGGLVRLELVNDGVAGGAATGQGSGLAGLAGRARALAGSVTAGPTGDGRFRLLVQLPAGHGRP